jgi:L,D-transpeptidase ErfK/SrfK
MSGKMIDCGRVAIINPFTHRERIQAEAGFRPRAIPQMIGGILLALSPLLVQAKYFDLPTTGGDLIGQMRYVKAQQADTLIDIAHDFSVGQDEMVMANPNVSRWLPGDGTKVLIPDRFILPDAPRVGILVNIPEMRMYYFPPGEAKSPATQVVTYPISIGRMDWKSPMGVTKIVEKIKNPTWTPPESIKKEHALEGEILPDVVPAGPDNPLGQFAMRLGVKGSYLIHGTGQDKADGIGMMVTHGCMRMYPEDVAQLFPKVSVGTQVNLVNQPVKVGWNGNLLYVEVSQPLDEDHLGYDQLRALALPLIQKKIADRPDFVLNEDALKQALQKPNGIPVSITGGAVGTTAQAERIPTVPRIPPVPVEPPPAPPAAPVAAGTATPPAAQAPAPVAPATSLPAAKPAAPVVQPAQPVVRPTAPVPGQPLQPPARVSIPTAIQPAQAPARPTAPIVGQPAQPTARPTAPVTSQPIQTPAQAAPVAAQPAPPRPVAIAPVVIPTPPTEAPPGPPVKPASSKPEEQMLPPIY